MEPQQYFTKPPARFSEAALVKELEKRGIGQPFTYAAIISTIQERGYVRTKNRRFYAEKMGEIITARATRSRTAPRSRATRTAAPGYFCLHRMKCLI